MCPPVPVDPRVRALRNINITLYVAALLMVASASLFIALALPAPAKVVGLGIVALGFYVAGLVMHAQSERLRPAAAAFTATGLALIPMTGLAHYFLLLSQTPGASWFVTSVVGTAAFVYAAARLQSKVIAGLATTFLVSTAYSGGAVLNRGLIYYFLLSMLLAAAITLVGFLNRAGSPASTCSPSRLPTDIWFRRHCWPRWCRRPCWTRWTMAGSSPRLPCTTRWRSLPHLRGNATGTWPRPGPRECSALVRSCIMQRCR